MFYFSHHSLLGPSHVLEVSCEGDVFFAVSFTLHQHDPLYNQPTNHSTTSASDKSSARTVHGQKWLRYNVSQSRLPRLLLPLPLPPRCHWRPPFLDKAAKEASPAEAAVTEVGVELTSPPAVNPFPNWAEDSDEIVGSRVRVYWDGDNEWYSGRIVRYKSSQLKPYLVRYVYVRPRVRVCVCVCCVCLVVEMGGAGPKNWYLCRSTDYRRVHLRGKMIVEMFLIVRVFRQTAVKVHRTCQMSVRQ